MSTYAEITATVMLDPAAFAALQQAPAWQWLDPADPAEGTSVLAGSDGIVVVALDGTHFRNLCRFLDVDLLQAQEFGSVTGMTTTDCQDGDHWRAVTRFDGRTALTGSGSCFNQPVESRKARILMLDTMGEPLRVIVPVETGNSTTLPGFAPVTPCACAGYERDADGDQDPSQPICATLTATATATATGIATGS